MLDDLGFGQSGCYGGQIETPHIDRLLKQHGYHTMCVGKWHLAPGQHS